MTMKKKRVLAAAITVFSLLAQSAGAEISKISYDDQNGEWRILGSFPNAGKRKAALEILKPGKTVNDPDAYAYAAEIPVNAYGAFDANFHFNGESGEYLFRLGAGGNIFEKMYVFLNRQDAQDYLQRVNAVQSASELQSLFEENYGKLKNICSLEVLPEQKETIYGSIYESIPKGGFKSFEDFKKSVAEVGLLYEFLNETQNPVEKLEKLFDYFSEDTLPAVDAWKNTELTSAAQKKKIAGDLQKKKPSSLAALENQFAETTVLTLLNEVPSKGKEITLLQTVHSLIGAARYDEFAKLSEAQKVRVLSNMSSSGYSSVSAYAAAFDQAVKAYQNDSQGGKNPGSSSGKGSGGSSGFVVTKPTDQSGNQNPGTSTDENIPFTDMDAFLWANPAVEKLRRSKIVSGKGDGLFAPADLVTREEFTAMILRALGMEDQTAAYDGFSDVKPQDWFYHSVSAANARGIISGISETEFGAGLSITRQDAVLICKNAAEKAGAEFVFKEESYHSADYATDWNAFEDLDTVSDYARDAVYDMQRAGIVSGKTDKKFVPMDHMTRAEAAVLIDKVMSFVDASKTQEDDRDSGMLDMLNVLGMYDGKKTGLDQELTREETAALLCGLLKLPKTGKCPYTDCTQTDEAAIGTVSAKGLLTGEGELFSPNHVISYEDAVKTAVLALGAGKAAEQGKGYLSIASEKGALKGVEKSSGGSITKRNFLRMYYNILNEKVYTEEFDGEKHNYDESKEQTLLSYYHDIYYEKDGSVTANARAGVMGEEAAGEGNLKIGNVVFENPNPDYDSYIGRNVEYYYRDTDGGYALVYLNTKKRTEILTINSDQIDEFKDMTYYYYQDDGDSKTTRKKITNKVNVVYNTETLFDFTDQELNPKSGTVTLVDADGNGVYDQNDTVIINAYKNIVVGSVNQSKEIIYDKYTTANNDYTLDLSKIEDYEIHDKHGDQFGLPELREWDVLAAIISPSGDYAKLTLVDEAYAGTLRGKDLSEREITVDDRTFTLAGDWRGDENSFKNGDRITVYWDLFGQVAAIREGIASNVETGSSQTASGTSERLAILTRHGFDEEDSERTYIKSYWTDEKFTYNLLAEKVKVNGERKTKYELDQILDEQMGKAVLLKMNENQEITEIITAALPGQDKGRGLWLITYPNENVLYKGGAAKSFGNRFVAGNAVYTIPEAQADYGDVSLFGYNNATFTNDQRYLIDAYTTTWQNVKADAVVYKAKKSDTGTFDTTDVFVVSRITETLNEDDEPIRLLDGYNYSIANDSVSAKSFELDDDAMVVDINGNRKKDFTIDDLAAGDVIRYGLSGSKLTTAMLSFDNSENWVTENASISAYTYAGYAYSIDESGTFLTMSEGKHPSQLDISSYENGGQYLKSFNIRKSALITIVDQSGKKTELRGGSAEEIETYVRSGNGCSRVVVCCDWQSYVVGVIVYVD